MKNSFPWISATAEGRPRMSLEFSFVWHMRLMMKAPILVIDHTLQIYELIPRGNGLQEDLGKECTGYRKMPPLPPYFSVRTTNTLCLTWVSALDAILEHAH
ncbi:hypothetical protein BDDG_12098 [Blastomyces dermatitidis ATCC 18188]|uniref:Uncharacterized protein n=1 Tax=Ajellomyces dermatitidis (strain ATCC 18188 / CBS 674.68) TaxID=653446 RepID=A0A0J9EMS3_AJEDA|nr:hypothetical protein BDDG_12098 [Blastomyces dermatitidis ATCC 18188]